MNKLIVALLRSSLVLFLSTAALAATLKPTGNSVAGEVIVKFTTGASQADIASVQEQAEVDEGKPLTNVKNGTIWRLHSSSKSVDALIASLSANSSVAYVEPNYILRADISPNDTSYGQLWGLKNTGQIISGQTGSAGADIDAESAWNFTTGSASIVIGVVDTGIDYTHPDLAANIWSNPGGKGNPLCAAGTHGFNAITGTCDPKDDHYHGTHCAGTIGAVGNNSLGVAGVNWTTSIMGLKFLNSGGSGTTANAIAAIEFAVQAKLDGVNVRVLSNSWGGGGFSKALLDEINKASDNDILFVAAAGNDAVSNDTYPHYPSSYGTANMISVAATDNRDALAYFSNYGLTSVHLGAPGVSVYSTVPNGLYSTLSGTSMATPHVAGVAALVLAQTPSLTTAAVKSAILNNTDPIGSLAGRTITGGRLNAARALGAPAEPDFSIAASPSSRSVSRGASTSFTVTVTPSNGFAGTVDLSVSSLPTGVTATFNPPSTTSASTLTLTTSNSTPLSTYGLTITGVSGSLTRTTTVLLSVVQAPPVNTCPAFSVNGSISVDRTAAVAVGDFNRDGKPDVVAAQVDYNRVVVLKGGEFGFLSPITFGVGNAPLSVAVGDVNGDGKPDIVTANSTSHNVSVLLGNGDATFQSAVHYAAGSSPFAVAIGDFNADGKNDLAVANNGSANVSILLGQGDGTFQSAVPYNAGSGPFALAIGDLNADGKLDVAVASFNADKVSVLLGNGDGTLGTMTQYAAGNDPSGLAIGDLDRDGDLDLAVSNWTSNDVSILMGDGNGTFQAPATLAAGTDPSSIALGDFNGDGIADLIVSNEGSNNVSVLMGAANGTFLSALQYVTGAEPNQVAVGDFNADGKPDLVVANLSTYYMTLLQNNGVCSANCNTLSAPVDRSVGSAPTAQAAADFNGDGKLDLAVANGGSDNVSIAPGNGDGTFQTPSQYGAGTIPRAIAAGDLNGDGRADVAVANAGSNNVSILLGNGNGTLQTAVPYGAGTSPRAIAIADLNRDGRLDLAVANGDSNNVSILKGNGNGTFQTAVNFNAGTGPYGIAVGDFNRDGKLDLAVANSGSNNVSILPGNGDGTFQAAANVTVGTSPYAVVAADLNSDGKPDLAVANNGSNNVTVRLGIGDGTFQPPVHYTVGTGPFAITTGDLNDDGKLDLAVANYGSNNLSVLTGIGTGAFSGALNSAAGTAPSSILAMDFNRDGKRDLAVANSGANSVAVLLNQCPVPDLAVTKTHSGSFAQGDTGKTYTITVNNGGALATDNTVTVIDTLPAGLTATAIDGTGWACVLGTLTCTRSDALAAGASYPAITLTVNVSPAAPASVTNNVKVSGGGELNALNDTASDPTTVAPRTDLTIAVTHSGSFTQGATGRTYALLARNVGGLATSGTVTVSDTLPTGLAATAMSGSGWNCTLASLTCTRNDVLAAGSNYPAITLTVTVAANAAASVTNTATVSGGGETNSSNNTALDPTVIWASQTCGRFSLPKQSPVGYYNRSIAVGDFNGDGKRDVALAKDYSYISILLGTGDGLFGTPTVLNFNDTIVSLAVSDLNNDTKLDLIITTQYTGVSVMTGVGDGTFVAGGLFSAGDILAYSGTVGDVNSDGNVDVVVSPSYSTNNVMTLLGNGNGTFQAPIASATGTNTREAVIVDVNGNGKPDLVIATEYNGVLVALGNGDGTFQAGVQYGTGSGTRGVATGDFNGDGKADLVYTNYYYTQIAVLIGNGDGTFQAVVNYPVAYGSTSVAIDDVNGDGNADLAVSNGGANGVSVLNGNGDGTFQSAVNYFAGYNPFRVVIDDFNGDGRADLAIAAYYDYSISVLLGGCADLKIAKSHSGQFYAGGTGLYSLDVTNVGEAVAGGLITVTDQLPVGLTATQMGGSGWSCTLATLTCTRDDTSGSFVNYPNITLFVSVAHDAPANITNTATVSGGGDVNYANNSASDPTTVVKVADLAIVKTHTGTFAQGQSATYTITVGNIGDAPTSGTVTVTDSWPFGLSPVSAVGSGWSCSVSPTICTRSDALAVGNSYPPITVAASVQTYAPATLTNMATVTGGGEVNTSNDLASDLTRILGAPSDLKATATSTTQVSLTWSPITHATSYQVLRSSNNGPFTVIGTPVFNTFNDGSLSPNTTYLYRVRAVDPSVLGPLSNLDLATMMLFTDDPIAGGMMIKRAHIAELRTAVNAVRASAGLPLQSWVDDPLTTATVVKAVHVTSLMTALAEARTTLGLPAVEYSAPAAGSGVAIRAVHIRDVRSGVK